jgi:hypothetical protein
MLQNKRQDGLGSTGATVNFLNVDGSASSRARNGICRSQLGGHNFEFFVSCIV